MRKSFALAAGLLVSAALGACNHDRHEDAGPVVSKAFPVGDFQKIEVAGSYDVEVKTGSQPSVNVRGPQNVLDHMLVEVKGDELHIGSRNRSGFHFNWGSHRGDGVQVMVTVPALSGAAVAGSGNITVDKVAGDHFDGAIAGSGELHVDAVEVKSLGINVAGSGDVKVGGKAQSAEYNIAGSGDLDAGGLEVQDLKVSIAGSGDVRAHATGQAQVSIMGSGDAEITGGAKCQVSKMGSGDAHCS
jgi:hypothetical protein